MASSISEVECSGQAFAPAKQGHYSREHVLFTAW